jgi:hypothetical protein
MVAETWIKASAAAGALLTDITDHLLLDAAAEREYGFTLAASFSRAQQKLLLAGTSVFILPSARAPCPWTDRQTDSARRARGAAVAVGPREGGREGHMLGLRRRVVYLVPAHQ